LHFEATFYFTTADILASIYSPNPSWDKLRAFSPSMMPGIAATDTTAVGFNIAMDSSQGTSNLPQHEHFVLTALEKRFMQSLTIVRVDNKSCWECCR